MAGATAAHASSSGRNYAATTALSSPGQCCAKSQVSAVSSFSHGTQVLSELVDPMASTPETSPRPSYHHPHHRVGEYLPGQTGAASHHGHDSHSQQGVTQASERITRHWHVTVQSTLDAMDEGPQQHTPGGMPSTSPAQQHHPHQERHHHSLRAGALSSLHSALSSRPPLLCNVNLPC